MPAAPHELYRKVFMKARAAGERGEQTARAYLEARGYACVAQNYRYGHCEIDLVMRQGERTVFVEVKARSGVSHGTPAEFVNARKQRNLIAAAQGYLQQTGRMDAPARFDVIEVYLPEGRVRHIEDAFGA